MMLPGFGVEECGALLAASREREPPRGHAGGWEPPPEALDVPDATTGEGGGDHEGRHGPGDRDRDLACDLIRLVRALVWAAILSQLATLALVGGLSGVNLAIQAGWINVSSSPNEGGE
jgi:hypothetical protein